jgi:NAD(P)-dependent dehydrogenase (short-subunit alcohol dehydrogenase family)
MVNKKNKGTVLITGGARRIGRGLCLALARLGYRVALHYHSSQHEAFEVQEMIRKAKGRCRLFRCNLADEKSTLGLIKSVKKDCPDLKVLINNASIFNRSTLRNAALEAFNDDFNIHVKAPFILTQQFARLCKQGHIINILDKAIVQNKSPHATYLLSKKALASLTAMSALELAPGIRVNGIAPGAILPPEDKNIAYLKKRAKEVPVRDHGNVEQIVQTVIFLIDNPFLNGEIIFVDGGEHLK